jgi:hypothetical protein
VKRFARSRAIAGLVELRRNCAKSGTGRPQQAYLLGSLPISQIRLRILRYRHAPFVFLATLAQQNAIFNLVPIINCYQY